MRANAMDVRELARMAGSYQAVKLLAVRDPSLRRKKSRDILIRNLEVA